VVEILMEIPDVVIEKNNSGRWDLMVGEFSGRFESCRGNMGMLFIRLNNLTPPMTLIEQWHCQFSSGEIAANMALVRQDRCWWLGQYFDNQAALADGVRLQLQLAEFIYSIAQREVAGIGQC